MIARNAGGRYIAREFDHPDLTAGLRSWYEWETVAAPDSAWSVMEPHGPSRPNVVQRFDGDPWAFIRDDMGHAYRTANGNGHWGSWAGAGSGAVGIADNISGCEYSGNQTLELFARNTNFDILHSESQDGAAPGGWVHFGGRATSDVMAIQPIGPEFVLDVFWRGTNGRVWTRRKDGSRGRWGAERHLGGDISSNLAWGRDAEGRCSVYARGMDDKLYRLRQESRLGDWPEDAWQRVGSGAPAGLTLLADPFTLPAGSPSGTTPHGIEIYVVASDHSIWTIEQRTDGTYGTWVSLGGKVWTGIRLRMSTVALEQVEDRFVDEAGKFVGTVEPTIAGDDGDMSFARTSGAIASASLPGLFPPVRLNRRTWVDGGIRRGVPIGAAIDAGAKRVIAVSTVPTTISPVGRSLPRTLGESRFEAGAQINDYSQASVIDIAIRSLLRMVDGMHWAELEPEAAWPASVSVSVIQPTFKIEGGDTIDPGLIRINYSYGWMRAFDRLLVSEDARAPAVASTDAIVALRRRIWAYEAALREAFLVATWRDATHAANTSPEQSDETSSAWSAGSIEGLVRDLRGMKRALTQLLIDRRDAGLALDPETSLRIQGFELFTRPSHWTDEWASHAFPHTSVFADIRFRDLDHREYRISPDAEPPPAL